MIARKASQKVAVSSRQEGEPPVRVSVLSTRSSEGASGKTAFSRCVAALSSTRGILVPSVFCGRMNSVCWPLGPCGVCIGLLIWSARAGEGQREPPLLREAPSGRRFADKTGSAKSFAKGRIHGVPTGDRLKASRLVGEVHHLARGMRGKATVHAVEPGLPYTNVSGHRKLRRICKTLRIGSAPPNARSCRLWAAPSAFGRSPA